MDKKEFSVGMWMLEKAFGTFKIIDDKEKMSVWFSLLNDMSDSDFISNVKGYCLTATVQPTIASIRSIAQIGLTDKEALLKYIYAIGHSAYGAEEQYKKLPPEIQDLTSPTDLQRLATTENLNLEVEGSNFMRSYKQKVKTVKEQLAIGVSFEPKQIGG